MARVALLTAMSMVAFAGNSLLARMALKESGTDAASFTAMRLVSGAVVLWAIVRWRARGRITGDLRASAVLFAYAVAFSFAYVALPAGLGALIMFGAAQSTMVGYGIWCGERLRAVQLAGLASAIAGLVFLMAPGLAAPPPIASALMLFAGAAWGVYCLLGAGSGDPLRATAGNFVRCAPMCMVLAALMLPTLEVDARGAVCAVLSGAIASGLAYAVWYTAMRELTTIAASAVQLTIPVLASIAGVALLGEQFTLRLAIGTLFVLGGVGVVLLKR